MERIRAIFDSLSKQELRYLKNFLSAFHSKGSNKALSLLELLEKNPKLSQAEASSKLYGNPKSKAFIMLKARLFEKMQETLVLGVNLQNNTRLQEDPAAYEVVGIIKRLSYALMLRKRGLEEIAREIFEKCEQQAKLAGLPEFRLPPLIYLQNIAASQQKGTWEYSGEISHTLDQYQTDVLGIGIFDEFNLRTRNHSHLNEDNIRWLREKTNLLENRLKQAYTVRTHYFYLNLLVSLYEGIRDHKLARETLEELIDLVASNKGLRSKNRLGTPYLKLAAVEFLVYDFEAACEAALKARNLYPSRKYNFFIASVYAIFSYIYRGKLSEASVILEELHWFREQKRRIQSLEISYYLESCILYLNGNLKEAFQTLGQIREILSDKEGWNTSLRIYEIILLIDMQKYDLASARIETLRKHVSKYKGVQRYSDMFQYLYALDRNSYDFQHSDPGFIALSDKLKNAAQWAAISHEVIRFDAWMYAKENCIPIQEALFNSLTHQYYDPSRIK